MTTLEQRPHTARMRRIVFILVQKASSLVMPASSDDRNRQDGCRDGAAVAQRDLGRQPVVEATQVRPAAVMPGVVFYSLGDGPDAGIFTVVDRHEQHTLLIRRLDRQLQSFPFEAWRGRWRVARLW